MVSNIWIIFHNIIWDVILPIDFHNTFIFFRGVGQPPTSEPSTQCSHQSTSLPLTKRPAGVHGRKTNGATAGIAEETTPSKFCENWALAKGAVSRRDFLLTIPECNMQRRAAVVLALPAFFTVFLLECVGCFATLFCQRNYPCVHFLRKKWGLFESRVAQNLLINCNFLIEMLIIEASEVNSLRWSNFHLLA